jgi:divalent metal cation (Fe/Co/Zn/Cd) transporter
MKVARQRKSAVLESNAIHHRVDSLTGIVALATIAISNFIPSLSSLDAVGGLLISYMVVRAGWANTMVSLTELADASVADELKDKVRTVTDQAVREALPHIEARAREVSGTKAGQNYLLDIELVVPGDQTIEELNKVECLIRERVATMVRGAKRIRVRFVPSDVEGGEFMEEFIRPSITAMSTPELDEPRLREQNHSHNRQHKPNGGNIKKDI